MPSHPLPFGSDTLEVPVYLAKGDGSDDPGFQRWKLDHPDWFIAGTWTPAPRPRQGKPPASDGSGKNGTRHISPTEVAELTTLGAGPLDPSALSVPDFQRVAAEARAEAASVSPTSNTSSRDLPGTPSEMDSSVLPSTMLAGLPASQATDERSAPGFMPRFSTGQKPYFQEANILAEDLFSDSWDPRTSPTAPSGSSGTSRYLEAQNITPDRMQHILDRHGFAGPILDPSAGRFSPAYSNPAAMFPSGPFVPFQGK